jgi:hypothetical protein
VLSSAHHHAAELASRLSRDRRCDDVPRPDRAPRRLHHAASSAQALAPAAGHHQRRATTAACVRDGKWLPFVGVHHHLPVATAYWTHRSVPWVGAGDCRRRRRGGRRGEEEVVRDRERRHRPSSERDGTTTTMRGVSLSRLARRALGNSSAQQPPVLNLCNPSVTSTVLCFLPPFVSLSPR